MPELWSIGYKIFEFLVDDIYSEDGVPGKSDGSEPAVQYIHLDVARDNDQMIRGRQIGFQVALTSRSFHMVLLYV
jgi:hypothetical protein